MTRKEPTVRFIKTESIMIGDTVKVEQEWEDCTVIRIGTVARRDHSRHMTEYLTNKGVVLLTHFPEAPEKTKISLLHRSINAEQLERLF